MPQKRTPKPFNAFWGFEARGFSVLPEVSAAVGLTFGGSKRQDTASRPKTPEGLKHKALEQS